MKNTSLKVPPGVEGTIIDVKVFNRRSGEKDERTLAIEAHDTSVLDQKEADHMRALTERTRTLLAPHVLGKQIAASVPGKKKGEVLAEAGAALTEEQLAQLPVKKLAGLFKSKEVNDEVAELLRAYDHEVDYLKAIYDAKREKVTEGDDLPPGVIKMVKVHIAIKRKLSVGDKMAGRHGNKGVVSCILPEEDMPFFADGRPRTSCSTLGRAFAHEYRPDHGNPPRLGRQGTGRQLAELVDSARPCRSCARKSKTSSAPKRSALVDGMDDEEFVASVKKLRNGIVTKTPVFDSATEDDLGLDGQGRSGKRRQNHPV